MAVSILRQPRTSKHQRLFELIRQDTLAKTSAARAGIAHASSGPEMRALRQKAEASIKP